MQTHTSRQHSVFSVKPIREIYILTAVVLLVLYIFTRLSLSCELSVSSPINNALCWLMRAQDAVGNGGVSYYYQVKPRTWSQRAYVEVTGYIISTLYDAAADTTEVSLAANLRARARRMADFEVASQNRHNGSFGPIFDTGQVIEGLVRAYRETGNTPYLSAAIRAGDYLISQQAGDGSWPTDYGGFAKPYQARVARALVMLWQATRNAAFNTAAIKNLDWDVSQQLANGWFQNEGIASTTENARPLTHTIAYTIEGLLDSGIILNNSTYINSAKTASDALLAAQLSDGKLSGGTYDSTWTPRVTDQCLTGDAQTALSWLKYYQYTVNQGAPDTKYLIAAHKLNQYLVGVQGASFDPGIHGGLPGSDPVIGYYAANSVLSWATKFFIDSLQLERQLSGGGLMENAHLKVRAQATTTPLY